jgi:hypothetical protein
MYLSMPLFLSQYIFAVAGMTLFGLNINGEFLTDRVNFSTFPTALLTLFRVMTGENW